jgi:hypothetical protein
MSGNEHNHRSPAESRDRAYEKFRESGWTREQAKRDAEKAARQAHDTLNKQG